jgi:Beta-lactamase
MSRAAGPAGATINATIDDLLAFAQMHLRGGLAADGTRVLSEASTRAMQERQVSCPEPELLGDGWGLGWFLRTGAGSTVIGHDGNTIGETACLRLIPERNVAWALLMNLSGQNWAAMEVAQQLIDPSYGTVTPGRPEPRDVPVPHTERLVGVYQSIGARLSVSADGANLLLDLTQLEAPDGTPAIQGEILPVADERFILRAPAIGDDLPLTFMAPDDDGSYQYLHMGARLYRRAANG